MTRNCLIPGLRWGGGTVLNVPKVSRSRRWRALLATGGIAFWDACLPTSATSRSPNRSRRSFARGGPALAELLRRERHFVMHALR